MKLKDAESWDKYLMANTDPYGKGCVDYARLWAELMEKEIDSGKKLEDIAEPTSHEADAPFGITGFMYGCAVSMLSQCWVHGEELRRWHNLKTQIGNEGERANESGGVLNPAVINIGRKDDEYESDTD